MKESVRPKRASLAFLSLVFLGGCFNGEADLWVRENTVLDARFIGRMDSNVLSLLQLTGQVPEKVCPPPARMSEVGGWTICQAGWSGRLSLIESELEHERTKQRYFDDVKIERIGGNRLRLVVPFDMSKIEKIPLEMGPDSPTVTALAAGLENQSVTLRIHAKEILTSTGTISEDRTTTTLKLLLTDLLPDEDGPPPPFVTTLRYKD